VVFPCDHFHFAGAAAAKLSSLVNMSDDENGEMEDVATPSDFLEHIPSKAQRIEVSFVNIFADGTSPIGLAQRHLATRPLVVLSSGTRVATAFTYTLVGLLRSRLISPLVDSSFHTLFR
jgi:hypothetical protein